MDGNTPKGFSLDKCPQLVVLTKKGTYKRLLGGSLQDSRHHCFCYARNARKVALSSNRRKGVPGQLSAPACARAHVGPCVPLRECKEGAARVAIKRGRRARGDSPASRAVISEPSLPQPLREGKSKRSQALRSPSPWLRPTHSDTTTLPREVHVLRGKGDFTCRRSYGEDGLRVMRPARDGKRARKRPDAAGTAAARLDWGGWGGLRTHPPGPGAKAPELESLRDRAGRAHAAARSLVPARARVRSRACARPCPRPCPELS
ncbi:uncharacterized protein LOC130455950 [Monodelphis domestica]|uniref:uncharacterized protein LOC130455950 n=1 Tax=Monodelphis domestica TaxID=13616 RepID=UPI0024E21CA3|nr:uncharacterized protein LOC130455950 [Monodelphis domestica]